MNPKRFRRPLFLILVMSLMLILIGSQLAAAQDGRACFPAPDGLTNWWPADGSTADLVGGQDAVLQYDAAFGPGLVAQAFHLDGDGDFVDVPHDPALDLGTADFTLDLWVYFNSTAGEQVLVEKWVQNAGFAAGSVGWTLTKLEGDVLRLAMDSGDGSGEVDIDSQALSIPTAAWTHFAVVRSGNVFTLYMNAKPVAGGTAALNLDSPSSLKFGHRGNPDDTPGSDDWRGFYLDGRIDEVQLFAGRALPRGLIQAIVNAGESGKCK